MQLQHQRCIENYKYTPTEEPIAHVNLASALKSIGHNIIRVDSEYNGNMEIKFFVFEKSEDLDRDIRLYHTGTLLVPAPAIFQVKDGLKNIINTKY